MSLQQGRPKGRLTIDIDPEMQRQLRLAAAAADKAIRDLVLAGVDQQIKAVQANVSEFQRAQDIAADAAEMFTSTGAQKAMRQAQAAVDAVRPQVEAAQAAARAFAPLLEQVRAADVALAEQAVKQAEQLRPALAAQEDALRPMVEGALEAQRQMFQDVLGQIAAAQQAAVAESVQQALKTFTERQQEAIRAALANLNEPFLRDWASDEDRVYDELS